MTKKNETVVKIAQTALMAALCFVSFQFLQFKIVLPLSLIHISEPTRPY